MLLEKQIVPHPLEKLTYIMEPVFTTVFTKVRHLLTILRQLSPVHALPSYFFKLNFNINLPSTRRSSKWSPSFRFTQHNPVCIAVLPHTCHTLHSYLIFNFITLITLVFTSSCSWYRFPYAKYNHLLAQHRLCPI